MHPDIFEKLLDCWRGGNSLRETRAIITRNFGTTLAIETIRHHFAQFCEEFA